MFRNRCIFDDVQFDTDDPFADVCPRCEHRERRIYAQTGGLDLERPLVPHTERWYQERLSVSGDRDE